MPLTRAMSPALIGIMPFVLKLISPEYIGPNDEIEQERLGTQ
jgi:hypothetical protein